MKKTSLVVLSMLLIAFAGFVYAQPGGGGQRGPGGPGGGPGMMGGPMGGPGGLMMMMGGGPGMGALFSEEGRRDIGLSDRQVQEIQTIFRDSMPRPGEGGGPPIGPNATEGERRAFMEQMETRMRETIGKIENVMTGEQLEKSRVRAFQAGGGYANLGNPFAQAALNITADQRDKLRVFQQEQGEKMRKFFEENRPATPPDQMSQEDRQRFFARMQQFGEETRKEMETKVQGILTEEQKKQGEKLLEETPEYIQRAINAAPRGPGARAPGQQPGGGPQYRPGADSWQPGQGAPSGGEAPQRRFPQRNRGNNN